MAVPSTIFMFDQMMDQVEAGLHCVQNGYEFVETVIFGRDMLAVFGSQDALALFAWAIQREFTFMYFPMILSVNKKARGDGKLDTVLSAISQLTNVITDNERKRDEQQELPMVSASDFLDEEECGQTAQTQSGANLSLFDSGDEAPEAPENDEFDFQLADIYDKHKLGPAVSKRVASSVTKAVRARTDVSALTDKYKIPKNAKAFIPPRTNVDVWNFLGSQTRTRDVAMQEVQRLVGHGMVPIVQLVENMRTSSTLDLGAVRRLLSDSLSVLCNIFYEISIRRRQMMRSNLPQKHLAGLCNNDTPITSKLFGDNVAKTTVQTTTLT
ncbi:uncharacterized protein LOC110462431 [Mizuhopecten yessoensis]|uniref:uncharacterized protein LOC110462431 n=1 Tax=Mizuhopecten yessoensis TaxID=6573 RepID=UPI000B45ED44|nr:uncharacterized protein LOC110462431 [Mizuhopecten yessoensis]